MASRPVMFIVPIQRVIMSAVSSPSVHSRAVSVPIPPALAVMVVLLTDPAANVPMAPTSGLD